MSAPAVDEQAGPHRRPLTSCRIVDEDGERFEIPLRGAQPAVWDHLISMYPDPAGQLPWDADGFEPALVHWCVTSGGMAVDPVDVAGWFEHWPASEVDVLVTACLDASAPGAVDWAVQRLRVDDRLAAEMAYCGPNGVPHSQFLAWSKDDQDKAIAWQVTKDDACPGCGIASRYMDDPEAGFVDQRRCVHCEALAVASEAVPEAERRAIHSHVGAYSPAQRRLIDRAIERGEDVTELLRQLRGVRPASQADGPERVPVVPSMTR